MLVISNIHEPQTEVQPAQGRSGVLFVGGFQHPPNVDAVEYYATEIWPLFRAENPGVETFIVGSRMPERLRKLGEDQGLTFLQDIFSTSGRKKKPKADSEDGLIGGGMPDPAPA